MQPIMISFFLTASALTLVLLRPSEVGYASVQSGSVLNLQQQKNEVFLATKRVGLIAGINHNEDWL